MSTSEIRLELHKLIDQIKDNRLLEAVYTLLAAPQKITAHGTDGKPLTKKTMDTMIEDSESDIKSGKLTNQESVEKEIESWRRK